MDVQALLKEPAHRIERGVEDLDALVDLAADASFVLLGEASHGTHEFYAMRAEITKRLIREKGFQAVAAEADWPDAYRVNEYVRGRGSDRSAARALSSFTRFPVWMWRNRVVEEFAGWLRAHNESRPEHTAQAGFYGLDLYSMNTSREAVMKYLDGATPMRRSARGIGTRASIITAKTNRRTAMRPPSIWAGLARTPSWSS